MIITQSALPSGRPRWAPVRRSSNSDALARRRFAVTTKDANDSAPNNMRRYVRKCDGALREGFSQRRDNRRVSLIMVAGRHVGLRHGTLIHRLKDAGVAALTTASIASKAYPSINDSRPLFSAPEHFCSLYTCLVSDKKRSLYCSATFFRRNATKSITTIHIRRWHRPCSTIQDN